MSTKERIKYEYELFYMGLCGSSPDQVFARAKEIYYKQLIRNSLLELLAEDAKSLDGFWCLTNILDYIYVNLDDISCSESMGSIKEEIKILAEKLGKEQSRKG